MEDSLKNIVYSKDTIEFTTVALQYCVLFEEFEDISKDELIDKLSKILPLYYVKAQLVPETRICNEDDDVEVTVTESDYNYILNKLHAVFAGEDAYLEVFLQDMKYSETPIAASISEDLTDIYQDAKNFISIYERGITGNMNDALCVCIENFKAYWGQKLVNVLRALHSLKYSIEKEDWSNDVEVGGEDTDNLW